jgi:hypothetical protein
VFGNEPGRIFFSGEDKVIVFKPFPFNMLFEHTERQIGKGHNQKLPVYPVSLFSISGSAYANANGRSPD